ncbi:C2 domain-containing protein 5 [Anabrus simplex]|uniref:C2 domain-containing protein 5 n=1 Tax=Anabrus simplex TaxID=316456 RepID=UPI0035A3BA50
MPGKVKVKIIAGRNLPVMDRSSDTTDAYVEIKLGNTTFKTDVCRKSLNPTWDSEWYRFEVDDSELQDEPLQIRLMDYDTYSANDSIGKVYLDLNPLLLPASPMLGKNAGITDGPPNSGTSLTGGTVLSGWIPVFDTMHGIRGEVNIIVKVELFSDFNKFRQSSCGVQFFCSPTIPQGYHAQVVHGFVEELVVNDDPEYQWIDKIRTPRASNEARQTLFFKLSGEVQRKIGLKALDLGGNAVVGYQQCFDLEGESGIVVRGIGTAVTLMKLQEMAVQSAMPLEPVPPCTEDGMFSSDISNSNGFVDGSVSGLQPLMLCVAPPTPRLCVISPSLGTSPSPFPFPSGSSVGASEILSPPRMSMKFLKICKPTKKKRLPVHVIPSFLSSGSEGIRPGRGRLEYTRHYSQPATDIPHLMKMGRSTQSLSCGISDDAALIKQLTQEEERRNSHCGSKVSLGMKVMRKFPHPKIGKKLSALKCKFQSDSSVEDSEADSSCSSITDWQSNSGSAHSGHDLQRYHKMKFQKKHSRSSSDSLAATLIRSLMGNSITALDRVVEVKESPGSSPTSPSRRESYSVDPLTPELVAQNLTIGATVERNVFMPSSSSDLKINLSESYLRLPSCEEGPSLRYVDGHLLSNTSSGISSSSDSSITDEDGSEDISLDLKSKEKTPPFRSSVSPQGKEIDTSNDRNVSAVDSELPPISCKDSLSCEHQASSINVTNSSCINTNVRNLIIQRTQCLDFSEAENPLAASTPVGTDCPFNNFNEYKQRIYKDHETPVITQSSEGIGGVHYGSSANFGGSIMGRDTVMPLKASLKDMASPNTEPCIKCTAIQNVTVPLLAITATTPTDERTDIETNFDSFKGAVIPSSRPCMNYLRSTSLTEPTSRIPTTSLLTEDVTLSDSTINLPERSGSRKFLTASGTVARNCIITPQMSIVDPTPSTACRMGVISAYDKRMAFSAPARDGSALLDIPVAPLHKSKSATSLLSHPVEHDTNYEDLQHHVKHGPCFVPTSRQLPGEEVADKPPSSPTSGVHSHVVAIASSSKISPSPARLSNLPGIHRRSSDSDLSITPKGNSLTGSDRSSNVGVHFRQPASMIRPTMNQESIDMLEYPFLTMGKYPPGFIVHLGGTVSSRSVKLLERITNLEEPETRDAWWTELRMEVRSHARALGCNVVLGYKENTSICDDVCVLSASGTAAVISLQYSEADGSVQHPLARPLLHNKELMTTSLDRTDFERDRLLTQKADVSFPLMVSHKARSHSDGTDGDMASMCSVCHIPYSESSVPFHVTMLKCAVCRRGKVPDVLFTTIELPEGVPTVGCGSFLQAYVCRPKRDCRGELNAKEISDGLPFLEYELHRMLNYKLKMKGMNAIFGLKVQVSIGERMMVGLATGTAVFLSPLPSPPIPKVSAGNSWSDERKLVEVQKQIQEAVKKNREIYQLKPVPDQGSSFFQEPETQSNGRLAASDTEESEDELPELDLAAGNKDTCVFEIDDAEDMDVVSLLLDSQPPDGFHVVNTEIIPGLDDLEIVRNLQMFTQVWRSKIQLGHAPRILNSHVNRLLQSVFFKLRRMIPCALCDLQFHVELPEPDEIQISVLGMALGLAEMEKSSSKCRRKLLPQSSSKELIGKKDESDMIFSLEEDQVVENSAPAHIQAYRIIRPQSPVPVRSGQAHLFKPPHTPPKERYGVDITPLSYVPGGKIERYLGNLNFFFIRESTCIREGGGLSGFVHSFVTEVLAIVRAHVTALGGNAMVAYFMSECVLYHNPHKNQGQCLINVGGDVVFVSYFTEEPTC